ncbi:MAG: 16S rRNA (guanine(527)-N(7))-methyltransferase RsmG [Planctomycetota bacterium]|nr:MAG: 16S rRNA (guanine(527)-N(7))-methyltransferase RsmG [Planctomycetota bacterium]
MSPFPGIPEDLLTGLEAPNPLDVGVLRTALEPLATPPDGPLRTLLDYGRLLLAANRMVNLTGAKDWRTLIHAHFLDCLQAARYVPDDARVVADWGSGAGLPGLVWAAVFPEKQILLLERNGKKAAFLKEAILRLELFQVEVLQGQGEERLHREEGVDLVVARAVEPLPKLLTRLRRNKVRHRSLFVMAGPSWEEAWLAMPKEQRRSWKLPAKHRYLLSDDLGERHLAVFKPA